MKKSFVAAIAMVLSLGLAGLTIAGVQNGKLTAKVGEEYYVCQCGEKCACDTVSKKAGKCSCGKEMAKAKVTKVEEGKAYFVVAGKEKPFKTAGKFTCACGPKCDCDTISQNPGKCGCGVEMKAVK